MKKYGFGIVGCGRAAADVAEAVDKLDGSAVVACYDAVPEAAERLAAGHHAVAHKSLEALLRDPAVEIVYAGLPHNLLAGVAEMAIKAGLHVLVEKPMALGPTDCVALGRLAETWGLKLCVYFELRQAGTVRTARELVQGGAIGAVRHIRLNTVIDKPMGYWQRTWLTTLAQAGGGVTLMNSVHQIDSIRFITGLEVTEATGMIATLAAPAGTEVEDTAGATMRLSNGGLLTLVGAAHSPGAGEEETISIDGEFGRIDVPSPWAETPVRLYLRRAWSEYSAGEWSDVPTMRPDFHFAMLRAFVDSIREREEPPATATDAAAALAVVMAVYQSAREGRAVPVGYQP